MKKLLLSAALLMGAVSMQAQIYTEVEENTYAITCSVEDLKAAYDETHFTQLGNDGMTFADGEVILDNEDFTLTSVKDSYFWIEAGSGKWQDMQKDFPDYTGYVNLGSNLSDRGWELAAESETGMDNPSIFFLSDCWQQWQSILKFTPKKDGKLSFGVYAGDNQRVIGIFREATEEQMNAGDLGGLVAVTNFRNDGENGTVAKAPAYVEGDVKAGNVYGILGGGNKNLALHQIKFVPTGGGTGITNVDAQAEKTVEAYYTLDGTRVSTPAKGIYIVKYSDGTAKKVVK